MPGKRALIPTEADEQRVLAAYLDHLGLLWQHPPNEAKRTPQAGRRMKALGMKAGCPDVLIFSRPPAKRECCGLAIELKRTQGGAVSPAQTRWLADLRKEGWMTAVCKGADEAIRLVRCLGYEERKR